MPLYNISQLIGKTMYVTKPISLYRVTDINEKGDSAKPIKNLEKGYAFVLDSYLAPVNEYTSSYGIHYATRSNFYFTFYGHDKNYYAVMYKDDGRFSNKKLQEQGAQTVVQQQQQQQEASETPIDKITETVKDIFTGSGKMIKTVVYVGLGVFAIGYLLPKFLKK